MFWKLNILLIYSPWNLPQHIFGFLIGSPKRLAKLEELKESLCSNKPYPTFQGKPCLSFLGISSNVHSVLPTEDNLLTKLLEAARIPFLSAAFKVTTIGYPPCSHTLKKISQVSSGDTGWKKHAQTLREAGIWDIGETTPTVGWGQNQKRND